MGIYCSVFAITSIYCAYSTFKDRAQGQSMDSCFSYQSFKAWIKLTWSFKRLYLAIIPHIFDQATDIAVIYEYYLLQSNNNIKNAIDTSYLFWISIILMLLSRLVSSIAIYKLTKNINDLLLGLLDLAMAKAIYVGYLLKRESPTNIQRYIGLLEATLEAFPQLLISTFYITTVVAHNDTNIKLNPLIPTSLVFSLYSLTARVASDDKTIYTTDWQNLEFKTSCKKLKKCKCINWRYILRVLMRFMEISSRLILYVLLWINFGGLATGIILLFEFCILLVLAYHGGSIEIIGNMMYYVMAGDPNRGEDVLLFLLYRFVFSYIYLIIITIFSNVNFNAPYVPDFDHRHEETIDSQFGLGLLIYCWICHFIWPCIGTLIGWKYTSRDTAEFTDTKNKFTTRSLQFMVMMGDCDDFVDLVTFGVSLDTIKPDQHTWDVNEVLRCHLLYYSMLHSVDENNSFILDSNMRDKANKLLIKHGWDKKIHVKKSNHDPTDNKSHYEHLYSNISRGTTTSKIYPTRWNMGTKLSRNGCGYLLLESNDIILDSGIELKQKGYWGNNEYNNKKSKIKNEQLIGKLYHGYNYEVMENDGKHGYRGSGTVFLFAKNEITMGNEVVIEVGNGNAFICCKKLIMGEKSCIDATIDNNRSSDATFGTIAIYCDELVTSGNHDDNEQIVPNFYRGSYQQGVNLMNQRN